MTRAIYAVKKHHGHWTVCSEDKVVLEFETYDEAVATARSAIEVLGNRQQPRNDKDEELLHDAQP